ncbi:MAG TPA: hypothetical protein PKE20_07420, partial [Promineifilum sp.]|nr:hypothetical protein [Promineifilum sp.]
VGIGYIFGKMIEAVARQPDALANSESARRFLAEIGPLTEGDVYLMDADGRLLAAESDVAPNADLAGDGARTMRVSVSRSLTEQTG